MKFNVRDEDGKEYKVEEIEEVEKTDDEDKTKKPLTNSCTNDDALTPDEIANLKKLAGIADKLAALIKTDDEEVEEEKVEEEEEIDDEDEQIEEVIDTDEDEPKKTKDSIKKSVGAIEKKRKTTTDDSVVEDDIATAWAKDTEVIDNYGTHHQRQNPDVHERLSHRFRQV